MEYQKKYPLTHISGKYLIATWNRGYRDLQIWDDDRLVVQLDSPSKLKAGFKKMDEKLGEIELKLSEKPIMLDIIVDRYHSTVNVNHPVKELKKTASFLWILMTMSFIAGMVEIGMVSDAPAFIFLPFLLINLSVIAIYLVSAILVGKGKPWAYYLAFSVFSFFTALSILLFVSGLAWGVLLVIFIIIRVIGEVILILNLKTVNSARKHLRFLKMSGEELLDAKY